MVSLRDHHCIATADLLATSQASLEPLSGLVEPLLGGLTDELGLGDLLGKRLAGEFAQVPDDIAARDDVDKRFLELLSKFKPHTPTPSTFTTTAHDTETTTTHKVETTVVTVTQCKGSECSLVPPTTGFVTVTDVATTYITLTPLPSTTTTTTAPPPPPPTSTASVTFVEIETAVVTITSCSLDKCHTNTVTTGLTTVTEDSTIFTTYCPLTTTVPISVPANPVSTSTDIETTLVTITSCKDNVCQTQTATSGVSVVSESTTVYTTYFPIVATSSPSAPPPASSRSSSSSSSSSSSKAPSSSAAPPASSAPPSAPVSSSTAAPASSNILRFGSSWRI
ncbi:uncharacterized protein LODBEIA_P36160 [Lodderomyces beijingensis]|uniref:Uncharacterized protein n=1 Tax=Lodderomyces beijingensis TaxID=1775926 RepID=A0ABP0ZSY6_9ASCO